jgi:formimidoylglutamate deiminase
MNFDEHKVSFPKGKKREARIYHFKSLLQTTGWLSPAYVRVDHLGIIQSISNASSDDALPVEVVNGFAIPAFQNAHSHAFQYAMAGMAEKHEVDAVDDFWSWREVMYHWALTLDPEQLQGVATMLYAELLKRGYTHVAEFQYLHHDKNGKPYSRLAEMSASLIAAASVAGIKITLIPVFYHKGGFGKKPDPTQRRFCFENVDQYFRLLDDCSALVKNFSSARVGFGVHSLRAASAEDIIRIADEGPKDIPFHIHAAEQLKEVNDALAFLNERPVEWLLNHLSINERFHLIHCTHLTDKEVTALGKSGAHVVLCPGTEANLGDGIFRLTDFASHSDHWSIGTDSHISLNPLEDLRWLDYTQRLSTHRRNTFSDGATRLLKSAFFSGKLAMGLSQTDYFEVGKPLDAVIYNGDIPLLNTAEEEHLLATLVYTGDASAISGTIVDGNWIAKELHHAHEDEILQDFRRALKKISRDV